MNAIDLRSDTVTRPTAAMREAMMRAPLGDDVLGDDPTVLALQERVAALMGKQAACFVPSGTMANQTAIRAQTEPGDEIICHEGSHIFHYEGGGPAVISGCMCRVVDTPDGTFGEEAVPALVRPDDSHFCRSRLLVLENTHNRGGGTVWPLERLARVTGAAAARGLRRHLDGARLWNASVASGVTVATWASHFDTVAACFSKGLGCPVGSIVVGDRATIARVHRARKLLGGGMRQAGMLAAAALHALDHHVERLATDHANARELWRALMRVPGLEADPGQPDGPMTNLVFFRLGAALPLDAAGLQQRLAARGVLALATGPRRMRMVTHLDVTAAQCAAAAQATGEAIAGA
ncbi:MAG: GntG family PLP-dependent aldolase [Phycisphaerae bacterium]|jgi:threonine aldolase